MSGAFLGAGRERLIFAAVTALVALGIALLVFAGPADARRIKGTNGSDKIKGTKKKDKIKAKGGNDKIKAKGGKDKVSAGGGADTASGGKGKDKVAGGGDNDALKGNKGKDSLKGGAGDDKLNAVDRKADKRVDGGPGTNVCTIDQLDLPVTLNCSTVTVPPGGGGGGGPGGGLTFHSGTGLTCGSQLPTCLFTLEGGGADQPAGTVTGTGGVTGLGGAVSVTGEEGSWTAAGSYGCTGNGALHVEIGDKFVDVPITCTT
jgi:Ca2+-binding RTX toxin-like protein